MNGDLRRTQRVGKADLGDLAALDSDLLRILRNAAIGTILRDQLFNDVLTRLDIPGHNGAIVGAGKGRAVDLISITVCNLKLPAAQRSICLHGLHDIDLTKMLIGEVNFRILMDFDLEFLYGSIDQPVLIFKSSVFIAGFFCIISTFVQIQSCAASFIGSNRCNCISAGFVTVDGDLPAFQTFTCVGCLMEDTLALKLIEPFVVYGFTCNDGNRVEAQLHDPVIVLRLQFHNGITARFQLPGSCITGRVGGVLTYHIPVRIGQAERPACQIGTGVGRLAEPDPAKLLIGVFHLGLTACSDSDLLFHRNIVGPVGLILVMDLADIIGTFFQETGSRVAITARCDRCDYRLIGIQNLEVPALGAAVDCILLDP